MLKIFRQWRQRVGRRKMSMGHGAGAQVHVSSERSSGVAFASRRHLDGLRFRLRLDRGKQAAAPHRTSERTDAHICRLYLGLLRTITDDYGAEFATHSDSLAYRTIGIYVFLRTVMCSPVRASQIAHALKLPRISVVRRLEEMIKHGYVERVGNAYRVTDKVNIPELQSKLQRRIDMVAETAKRLAELGAGAQ